MLGWRIVISAELPGTSGGALVLASWDTGWGGTDWLHQLVDAGKATQRTFDGYSNRFTVKALEVLPWLAKSPPVHRGPAVIGDSYATPAKLDWQRNPSSRDDRLVLVRADACCGGVGSVLECLESTL